MYTSVPTFIGSRNFLNGSGERKIYGHLVSPKHFSDIGSEKKNHLKGTNNEASVVC